MLPAWPVKRVIWSLVGLFTLCVVGVSMLVVHQYEREAEAAAGDQAESLARAAETSLNRSMLGVDLMLAGLPDMRGLMDEEQGVVAPEFAPQVLKTRVAQSLAVRDLILIDAQGRVIVAADDATQRLGIRLPAGFLAEVRAQPAPRLAISVPATHESTGEKALYMARVLEPGEVVAVAEVPVATLTALMKPAVDLEGVSITLEDDRGTLLASAPMNDSLLGRRHPSPLSGLAADGRPLRTSARMDDEPAFVSVRPSLYPTIRVSAAISESAVRARTQAVRRASALVGGAFVLLGGISGLLAQVYLARLRAANAATLRTRSVLEEALASMDEGFLLWDADDRVLSWNERYLQMFPHMRSIIAPGVSLRRMSEAGAEGILPQADADQRRAWIAARELHRSDGLAFEQRLPDGTLISSVERRTSTGGIVSIYRDVTRDRAAARELERARQVAESANEAKTRFLATMSHEIRTPLNGILGMNELLLHSPLDERQRRQAETIRASGDALLTILNDILDMSRLEAGGMGLEPMPFDPQALVDETVSLLHPRATAKGIALRVQMPPLPLPRLVGDAGRLRQVLVNLVGNAVKFTDRGEVVVISSASAAVEGRLSWRLMVRDTGIGIPAQVLPTLFERFTQADTSTSRRYGGSGLGLAICRQLVELMGGRIELSSEPGQGSEFCVTVELPAAPSADEPPHDAPGAAPVRSDGRRLRMLVAEDNPVNQMLMKELLAQMGHEAEIVGDGREAVERARTGAYDLVLMDIQMPEMDGVEATRAIRGLPGAAGRVPIVAVTANVLPEQRELYLSAGMNDYVAKPLDHDRLRGVIARLAVAA